MRIETHSVQSKPTVRQTPSPPWGEEALRRRLLEVLQTPTPPKLTYEEFLAWADEDTLAEWVDGEIVMTSPASLPHQNLALFLGQLLGLFAEDGNLGTVILAPFQMKLATAGREPDLIFLATAHLSRLQKSFLDGPADLVVEIVSPESVGRDRGDKFYEYAQGGVLEYWLLDPQRRWAEFYHLEGERYRLAFAGQEGEYRSHVLPGFWLQAEWLWQQPLPKVLDILRELGIL